MGDLVRMRKMKVRVGERDFPFVVHVAVPDGGFECTLGAINAWHHHNGKPQHHGQRSRAGEQEFWRWCFEGLEIAKAVRHRFGGEILPVAVRLRADGRAERVSRVPAAAKSERTPRGQDSEVKRARSIPA